MAVVWGASTAPSGKQARGQRQSRGLTSNRHAGARAGDSPGVCRFRSDPTICVAPDWIPIDQRTSRHPGLVPGSNAPQALAFGDGWMPERVRHDAEAWEDRNESGMTAGFEPIGSRSEEHPSELQSLMRISYA